MIFNMDAAGLSRSGRFSVAAVVTGAVCLCLVVVGVSSATDPADNDDSEKTCVDLRDDCGGLILLNNNFCTAYESFARDSCSLSCKFCTPPCTYGNTTYVPGMVWRDGCFKKCQCVTAGTGAGHGSNNDSSISNDSSINNSNNDNNMPQVHCEPLCDEQLEKVPSHCRHEYSNHCPIRERCWDKFHNVTRQVGEEWRVECRFKCRCRLAKQGYVTECANLCPTWDFDGVEGCRMTEPLPGKCCSPPCCHGRRVVIPKEYEKDFYDDPSQICKGF